MAKKPIRRILPIVLAGCAGIAVFLFYGPFEGFRRLWINTVMYSSRHQFLATMLYSRDYIGRVLEIPFPMEQTNPESLDNLPGNEVLFAELKGDYYRGYIIKIEDPRRLSLVSTADGKGELLEDLVASHQGLGGVNGAGYRDHIERGLPWGTLIIDGDLVSPCNEHMEHSIGGLTKANKLVVGRMIEHEITAQNYKWAFEFGPILIINGEKTELHPYSGGLAPRTAIGQTSEGHILLVVIDGRQISSIGATFSDVQNILYENGAINAISLDGGASSCLVYQGELISKPSEGDQGRLLPNALVYK